MDIQSQIQNKGVSRKQKLSPRTKKRYIWALIFIIPQTIMFIIFSLYPIVMSYVYSFFEWDGLGPLEDFIGFENYITLFKSSEFWNAFKNTILYVLGTTILSVGFGLLLARILNDATIKGKSIYRTLYFLPVVTTTAIIGIIMSNIFGVDGLVNQFLLSINLIEEPIPFLTNGVLAMFVLIAVGSWKALGINMIYWLAGLQGISKELFESAQIDGAGFWTTLRYITLPLLKPMMAIIVLLSLVNGMHVFDLVKTLTNGDPYFKTEALDLFIYNYAFSGGHSGGDSQMGYASAAGVLLGLFTFFISVVFAFFGVS